MQLKKKSSLYFFTSLACFTLASSVCFSLPSAPIAQSGRVEVTYPNSHTMVIKPSDDARLHYEDFQIGPGEKVLFMQSATSCASHHITGKNSSQILGSIQSNGKVVLVNRHGIVFGKNSEVETGALLVSTLENVDANDFHISSEGNSSIVNEGVLRSKKGSLTLLAPQVRNEGSLEAASVFLASGEVIKLEGSSLSVSGSLKEGLVEQLGNIQASSVLIKLPMRTKSITKNDKTHELFIEEHGSVILGSTSQTKAQKVAVEGTYISVQGSIDATSTLDRGGTVHLLGKEILLQGAKIDSSGLTGGEVLIGGEFQGKGNTPYASKVSMDTSSEIYADGLENGDGGLVVLWSQDRTLFEGKIFAKSGVKTGSGGLVETSSKGSLEVRSGKVNTWSADGKMGQWLLDPKYVKIVSSGSSTCGENKEHTICGDCTDSGTCNLPVSVFSGLESNLTIQSTCGTVITTSFNVTTKAGNNKKANLTFYLCPGDFGCSMQFPKWSWELVGCVQVYDSNHSSGGGLVQITTDGGSLTFPSDYYSIFSIASLDINTNGGDINIPARVEAYVSNLSLTLNAGSGGVITFGTLTGNVTGGLFQQINIGSAEHVSFSTNIQLYGPFTCTPPIHIPEGSSFNINTTGSSYISGGGDILLSGGVEGPGSLTFNAGSSHSVTVGSVGSSTPVASFSVSSSNAKSLSLSRVSTSSGNISIDTPVTLTGNDTILSSKGGSITLPSSTTFTGSKNSLTIDAGSGDINIPGIPSFNSISILGGNVTVGSGLSASGKITLGHTGTATINGGISAGGDFLDTGTGTLSTTSNVSANTISFTGNPTLTGTFKATSSISFGSSTKMSGTFTAGTSMSATGSVELAGTTTLTALSGIVIGSQISSIEASDLILDASAASISIGGDVVGLRSFTVKSASDISFFDISTQGDIVIPCSALLRATSVISSDGGNVTFSGTLNPSVANCNLTINSNSDKASGAISLKGLGTAGISLANISLYGGVITLGEGVSLSGTFGISNSEPMTISSGNVVLGGSFNQLGTAAISLGSSITAGGSISFKGPLTIANSLALTGSGGITLSGPISMSVAAPNLSLDAGSHVLSLSSLGSSSAPFGAVSIKASSLSLNGDIYSTSSLYIGSSVAISQASTLTAPSGISITGDVSASSGTPSLTLLASSGPVETHNLGSSAAPLGAVSLTGSYITLGGSITSNASIAVSGTTTITSSIALTADQNITLGQDLSRSTDPFNLTIKATNGTVSVQNLGSSNAPLGNISMTAAGSLSPKNLVSSGSIDLSGATITLDASSTVSASGNITINNTGPLTIPSGSLSVKGNFAQTTESSVSLGTSIETTGTISFAGPLTITGSTVLRGTQGISINKSITPGSSTPDLTLDAGSHALTLFSLGSSSTPFGTISIQASNLVLNGDIAANSSIFIGSPVSIAQSTTLTGVNGISIIGTVSVSSGTPSLTLLASSGPVEAVTLGSSTAPLGSVSLKGSYITLGGSITSNASIAVSGAATITTSIALTADQNITLDQGLSRSTDPFNLTIKATNGTVSVQNLGSSNAPLGNISITAAGSLTPKNLVSSGSIDLSGAAITLDAASIVSASGNITINNTGPLTIPSGSLSVKGNFAQTTESSVSLGTSIETTGTISFAGPLTITGSTVLQGTQGVAIHKSITPGSSAPDLTLNAGTQPLTVVFAGDDSNPFGAISIQGSDLTLQGNLYSNTSIVIYPPVKISADTIINSLNGYGGLALLKPVTASSGNPSLTVYAANALVDVASLGSDEFPLGNVVLTGSYVTLNGDIVSSSAVEIGGAVTITAGLTLIGSSGVTLKNQLLPSTNPFDLTLQACDGSVSVQSLGNSVSPLKNVSLIGVNGVTVSGTITTTGILTIVDEEGTKTCGSGTYPPCNSQSP